MHLLQFGIWKLIMHLLDKLRYLLGSPTDNGPGHDLHFNGDVRRWNASMQHEFELNNVTEVNKTTYAIETGLKTNPEVQTTMRYRLGNYTAVSRGDTAWPYTDFVYDLLMVNDEARKLQSGSVMFTSVKINIPLKDEAKWIVQNVETGVESVQEILADVHPRIDSLSTLPRVPNWDEILERIKPVLDNARRDLERLYKDGKAKAEDIYKAIHDFIQAQLELLPKEFQYAVQRFQRFKSEHPYIVAGAEIALVVIAAEVVLPYAVLGVLRLVGFGEMGPVAGAWAPALQSAFYGGRTRGLFSILQQISMTGRLAWPIEVFTGLTAAVGGTVALIPPAEIKHIVEQWVVDYPFPISLDQDIVTGTDELKVWMEIMQGRLEKASVPHAQWLDVAIEALRQRVVGSLHA